MNANKAACAPILTFVMSSVAVLAAPTLSFSSLVLAEASEKEFLTATSKLALYLGEDLSNDQYNRTFLSGLLTSLQTRFDLL